MCIKTRIIHWRETGLVVVLLGQLLAISTLLIIGLTPVTLTLALTLILVSNGYALYLSPQARDIRRFIVSRRHQST